MTTRRGPTPAPTAAEDIGWRDRAACAGMDLELFFGPNDREDQGVKLRRERQAQAVCWTCPVATECGEYALRQERLGLNHRCGVWGGMTAEQRQALERTRRKARQER